MKKREIVLLFSFVAAIAMVIAFIIEPVFRNYWFAVFMLVVCIIQLRLVVYNIKKDYADLRKEINDKINKIKNKK